MKDLYYVFSILTFFVISMTYLSSEPALNDQILQTSSTIDLAEESVLAPGRFYLQSHRCRAQDTELCCCGCVSPIDCGIISATCEIPAYQFSCPFGGPFECSSGLGDCLSAPSADCVRCCMDACGP